MAKEPEKTKLELAKEAQIELHETMIDERIKFLETMQEFKSIGGSDNVEATVLRIVEHFKPGIPFLFLQTIAPDAMLSKAIKDLKAEGKIEKLGKKGNVIIKLAVAK